MKLHIKRVYDAPSKADGTRMLVDRLWPRGVSKKDAHIDIWAKDLAPTNTLRKWFHKDPEARYKEFSIKYRAELSKSKKIAKDLISDKKVITLVTSVHDPALSHIPTLTSFLKKF